MTRNWIRSLSGMLLVVIGAPSWSADAANETKAKAEPEKIFAFTAGQTKDSFDFETKEIQGTLRLDGPYHGVTRLVDRRTGRQVIDTRYSALNLFRLFSTNQGMGQPRLMERTIKNFSNRIEATWPATKAHQGEITALYSVAQPNAVDLTVTVKSQGTYPAYEIFMSSYFDKALRPHVYLRPRARDQEPQLVAPIFNEVFKETVLVFARDAHASRRCVDGRWDRSEFDSPTVQMCPVRHYGHCLAFQTDPDKKLAVVMMANPRHCYAISARYHADQEADRQTPYSAFDLSLFGYDLTPGDQRTVKVRLALTALDKDMSEPLKMYRAFLAESEAAVEGNSIRKSGREELRKQ